MNTKLVMTASALVLGLSGIALSFLPQEAAAYLQPGTPGTLALVFQLLGALYFAFALLNWMAKGSLIGGIYNRPLATANFTHFFMGALALIKAYAANPAAGNVFLPVVAGYAVFAFLFGLILFRHPVSKPEASPVANK
jgi:hypothetical protein